MSLYKENGNVTIFSLLIVMAAVMGTLYIGFFYGGFVTIRQTQNAMDAAGMAATQELRNLYVERMKSESEDSVDEIISDARAERAACLAARDEDDPPCPPLVDYITAIAGDLTDKIYPTYNKEKSWIDVVDFSYQGKFTAENNGDYLVDTFVQEYRLIYAEAVRVAQLNNADTQNLMIRFPWNGKPDMLLEKGSKDVDTSFIKSGSSYTITSDSASGLKITEIKVDVSKHPPRP